MSVVEIAARGKAAIVVDRAKAFRRSPSAGFRHDGFGHDQNAGVAGDPCIRVRPHSGIDETGVTPVFSPRGGVVRLSAYSIYSGHTVIEQIGAWFPTFIHLEGDAWRVPVGHLSHAGDLLATSGDSGMGMEGAHHLHMSVATSMEAAMRLFNGAIRARYKGESVDAWADAMGLVDPEVWLARTDLHNLTREELDVTARDDIIAAVREAAAQQHNATPFRLPRITVDGKTRNYFDHPQGVVLVANDTHREELARILTHYEYRNPGDSMVGPGPTDWATYQAYIAAARDGRPTLERPKS